MTAPPNEVRRIAMWSGPRNVSTALLRAWENRPDTAVVDEPFYAHYLDVTGFDHPARDEILAAQPRAAADVVSWLLGPVPGGARIFYQKQMTHHLLPGVDRAWLDGVAHAFLIRDPGEMIASYLKIIPNPSATDLGMPQMTEVFERVRERTGETPPVVDSKDLLEDPAGMLRLLCERLDVPFDERMLSWPAGTRDSDGVWAPHWYANVERSTGFEPYTPREVDLAPELHAVRDECEAHYRALHEQRLRT